MLGTSLCNFTGRQKLTHLTSEQKGSHVKANVLEKKTELAAM